MSIDAIKAVLPHLSPISVFPVNIALNRNFNAGKDLLISTNETATFSRFRWRPLGEGIQDSPSDNSQIVKSLLMVMVDTLVEIAIQPDTGPIPESEEIPEDLSIAKIEVTFACNYACDISGEDLDKEGVQAFIDNNVPYHFWPYWRELVQNLAMRSNLPVPSLPSYRVPAHAQK